MTMTRRRSFAGLFAAVGASLGATRRASAGLFHRRRRPPCPPRTAAPAAAFPPTAACLEQKIGYSSFGPNQTYPLNTPATITIAPAAGSTFNNNVVSIADGDISNASVVWTVNSVTMLSTGQLRVNATPRAVFSGITTPIPSNGITVTVYRGGFLYCGNRSIAYPVPNNIWYS
jgi:hypothetical protein